MKIVSFFGDKSDIFIQLNERTKNYAKELGIEYKWIPQLPFNQEEVIEELKLADAGIIDIEPYGEEIFSQIKENAKILIRYGVGYDQVDLEAASRHGIAIARTTGANTTAVAEMALTLILANKRKINKYQALVKEGNWLKEVGNEIIGSIVGIVGFGGIGKRLARLLSGFDCKIVAYDPYPNQKAMDELGVESVSLEELFKISDAISIHVPYCEETHYMINESLLSLMKPTSVIVNTSRGKIVDEDALYRVLKKHKIAGAGFDVFEKEPLPLTSSLLELDNIVLTPHVSSQTYESLWNIYKMAIDIAADFFEGKESPHILNTDYKK